MGLRTRIAHMAAVVAIAGAAFLLSMTGGIAAEPMPSTLTLKRDGRPPYAAVGRQTDAPVGWIGYCGRYKCDSKPEVPRDIILTLKAWDDLVEVNRWVNTTILPLSDRDHWGEAERWDMAESGFGDCEDYVLLKQSLLMLAHWPQGALLITVVLDNKGESHAVLTVKTDLGEYILDNIEKKVLIWYRTGYTFLKRQSQFDKNIWLMLEEPMLVSSLDTIDRIYAAIVAAKSTGTLALRLVRPRNAAAAAAAAAEPP